MARPDPVPGSADRSRPSLTVAMPAFNEIDDLERVIGGIQGALAADGIDHEVLIVDDGSTDGTGALADELAARSANVRVIHHGRNRGFGAAWRSCVSGSRGDWVFLGPADGQMRDVTPARFYSDRRNLDVLVGVRRSAPRPIHRRILTWAFYLLAGAALGVRIRGFALCLLFRGDLVRSARTRARDASPAVMAELLFLCKRAGARVGLMEVDVLPREAGSAKGARVGVALATLVDLIALGLRYRVFDR